MQTSLSRRRIRVIRQGEERRRLTPAITRRLLVVPLANNRHGKTQLVRAVVRQGERRDVQQVQQGPRVLASPWGRSVDALVIPRSYQETLARKFRSAGQALNAVDHAWRQRDLIILPSHLKVAHCASIIKLAHGAGFDAIVVSILLRPAEIAKSERCLTLAWDERWTLSNDHTAEPAGQVEALGHDLWTWIAAALERR